MPWRCRPALRGSSSALSWLGAIRPTSANDAFDSALWETFVSTTLGLEVPTLAALPRLHTKKSQKCTENHGNEKSKCDLYGLRYRLCRGGFFCSGYRFLIGKVLRFFGYRFLIGKVLRFFSLKFRSLGGLVAESILTFTPEYQETSTIHCRVKASY